MLQRLQKIISAAGAASRRGAESLIAEGRVCVNGVTATLGMSADPDADVITLDGKPLCAPAEHTYIMLHKPRGYVTTLSDEKGRHNVSELVRGAGVRLYPVGRLDMYSEGLLIMTNDGDAANRLMHPSHHVDKTYLATISGPCPPDALERLRGVLDIDGCIVRAHSVEVHASSQGETVLAITIGEGRNRQVRKMCSQCGLKLTRLCRIRQGALELGDLPPGKWRPLTAAELDYIRKISG